MRIKFNIPSYIVFVFFTNLFAVQNLTANPWLDTGDLKLRHQLQLLSDANILDAPLTTWPLASKDIHRSIEQASKTNKKPNAELFEALTSINARLAQEDYGAKVKVEAKARSKELLIRDFSTDGRDKSSLSYDGSWGNALGDVRLKATISESTKHNNKNFHLDESYVSSALGNWKFTVGKQSRWWGPGWDGSLILSNNAKPIPSLSLDRETSTPSESKLLRWMGPWKLSMFAGQLESNRTIAHPKLLGARLNFRPTKSLEVGLSRVIQWGGEGRPQSLSSLFDAIIGNDNFNPSDPGKKTEPGNQLAGADFRWKSPVGINKPYAVYGQLIGEDEAGLLPSRNMGLIGFETWGTSAKLKGSWRTYLEASDTSLDFYKSNARNNGAYNHSIYKDGYRFNGMSMGHSIDSDSKIFSMGAILSQNNGNFWHGWTKYAKLNVDGKGINTIAGAGKTWSAIGMSLDKPINNHSKLNLGLQYTSEKENGKRTENDFGASIGYSYSF